jgi:hypothetical protein
MDHLEFSVVEHPSTALFGVGVVPVFGVHCFLGVDTIQVLEVRTVILQHFAEYLSLYLLNKLLKSVAVDKEAFARGVRVKVKEKIYSVQRIDPSLNCPNGFAEINRQFTAFEDGAIDTVG